MDDDVVAPRSRRARNIHKSLKSKDSLVLSYHLRVMVWLRVKLRLRDQKKTSLAGNILRPPPAIWIVMETCRRKNYWKTMFASQGTVLWKAFSRAIKSKLLYGNPKRQFIRECLLLLLSCHNKSGLTWPIFMCFSLALRSIM